MMKLDVGCGKNKKKGYLGVDLFNSETVDYVFDLEKIPSMLMPFTNSQIDEIWCSHTLEHVSNLVEVMNEFHRILKPVSRDRNSGGLLTVIVPSAKSWAAFASPYHKRFFVPETFRNYFASDMLAENKELDLSMNTILPWHITSLEWTQVPANSFDIAQEIKCVMRPLK